MRTDASKDDVAKIGKFIGIDDGVISEWRRRRSRRRSALRATEPAFATSDAGIA